MTDEYLAEWSLALAEDESQHRDQPENRVIIAGGRDFSHYGTLVLAMENYVEAHEMNPSNTVFISGKARGADNLGELWARSRGYVVWEFPADWDTHGKRAGYLRNEQMAENATHLVAFWDGASRGTGHMIDIAAKKNILTQVERY